MPICSALLKYGYSNFTLEIIEYCDPSECISREKYYLNLLKPEYNIIQDPSLPPMSGRTHSEESRAKMSHLNHPMYGKNYSTETIAKYLLRYLENQDLEELVNLPKW